LNALILLGFGFDLGDKFFLQVVEEIVFSVLLKEIWSFERRSK
jgi:hypothetical protein